VNFDGEGFSQQKGEQDQQSFSECKVIDVLVCFGDDRFQWIGFSNLPNIVTTGCQPAIPC
jgi:hypothetical protein